MAVFPSKMLPWLGHFLVLPTFSTNLKQLLQIFFRYSNNIFTEIELGNPKGILPLLSVSQGAAGIRELLEKIGTSRDT